MKIQTNTIQLTSDLDLRFIIMNNTDRKINCFPCLSRELVPAKKGAGGHKAFISYKIPDVLVGVDFDFNSGLVTIKYVGEILVSDKLASEKMFMYHHEMMMGLVERDLPLLEAMKKERCKSVIDSIKYDIEFLKMEALADLKSIRSSIDTLSKRIEDGGKVLDFLNNQVHANYNEKIAKISVLKDILLNLEGIES